MTKDKTEVKEMTEEAARNIALQQQQAIASAEAKVQRAEEEMKAAKLALAVAKEENK